MGFKKARQKNGPGRQKLPLVQKKRLVQPRERKLIEKLGQYNLSSKGTKEIKKKSIFPTINETSIDEMRHRMGLSLGNSRIKIIPIGYAIEMTGERPKTRELNWREQELRSLLFEEPTKKTLLRVYGYEAEHASHILQRNWRRKMELINLERAATKIQTTARIIIPKKKLCLLRRNASARTIQRVWRGHMARKNVALYRLWNKSATYIEKFIRGYLSRKIHSFVFVKSNAVRIQSFWRKTAAKNWYLSSRTKVINVQAIIRGKAAMVSFHNAIKAANKIAQFWKLQSYKLKLLRIRSECINEQKVRKATEKIQNATRALIARKILKSKLRTWEPVKLFLEIFDNDISSQSDPPEGESLLIWHLIYQKHLNNPKIVLKDLYRKETMLSPKNLNFVCGYALVAAWESDHRLLKTLLEKINSNDEVANKSKCLIKNLLVIGMKRNRAHKDSTAYSASLANYALYMHFFEKLEDEVVSAFEKIENLVSTEQNCDENALRHAERFLTRYHKDISAGAFFSKPYIRNLESRISGISGKVNVWRRGLNFKVEFTKSVADSNNVAGERDSRSRGKRSTYGKSKSVTTHLLLSSNEVRRLAFRLDRRDLLLPCSREQLIRKCLSFLVLTRDNDSGKEKLILKFQQEPFPKMTRLAKSTNSFLSIVAYPWESDSDLALDLVLYAVDTKRGEEFSVKVSCKEIEEIFADKSEWLRARKVPGWRKASKCLVGKLVDLLDIVEIDIPHKGDYVIWERPYTKGRRNSNTVSWYQLGIVLNEEDEVYTLSVLEETGPPGTFEFYRTNQTIIRNLDNLRSVNCIQTSNREVSIINPTFDPMKFPSKSDEPFRQVKARRKMILRADERKLVAKTYCAARTIQKVIRGWHGRTYAKKLRSIRASRKISKYWRRNRYLWIRIRSMSENHRKTLACEKIQHAWRMEKKRGRKQRTLDRIELIKSIWVNKVPDLEEQGITTENKKMLENISVDVLVLLRRLSRLYENK